MTREEIRQHIEKLQKTEIPIREVNSIIRLLMSKVERDENGELIKIDYRKNIKNDNPENQTRQSNHTSFTNKFILKPKDKPKIEEREKRRNAVAKNLATIKADLDTNKNKGEDLEK